jgi:hypothetical protein
VVLEKTCCHVVMLGKGFGLLRKFLKIFLMEYEVGTDVAGYNRVQSRYSRPIYKQIETLYDLPRDSDLLFA